ncbi:hypothetical protein AB674_09105 [Flavobacterium sp. ABG]|nr:hypothetical protein AB674_09105 [Flavobacterium sp. ABG]
MFVSLKTPSRYQLNILLCIIVTLSEVEGWLGKKSFDSAQPDKWWRDKENCTAFLLSNLLCVKINCAQQLF